MKLLSALNIFVCPQKIVEKIKKYLFGVRKKFKTEHDELIVGEELTHEIIFHSLFPVSLLALFFTTKIFLLSNEILMRKL